MINDQLIAGRTLVDGVVGLLDVLDELEILFLLAGLDVVVLELDDLLLVLLVMDLGLGVVPPVAYIVDSRLRTKVGELLLYRAPVNVRVLLTVIPLGMLLPNRTL